jgi:fermentation-respiration switch protein FrsA (DUF1100 family)
LVLESVYPTIEEATRERLRIRLGALGPPLAPLLLAQLHPRLGVSPLALRPIAHVSRMRCPVFVISGTADRHTPPAQARALFARAPDPKQIWLVPGAAHVDLERFAGEEYGKRVLRFLSGAFARAEAGKARHRVAGA